MRYQCFLLCLCGLLLSLYILVYYFSFTSVQYSGSPLQLSNNRLPLPAIETMPFQDYIKNEEEFKEVKWQKTLHDHLLTLNEPYVNMVNGDYKHRVIVENWIVAAVTVLRPPLKNVLVMSLDHKLCDFLANSSHTGHLPITCFVTTVDSVLTANASHEWIIRTMVRPITVRLINYWGYDVATYDSDAVVLKNPQKLYQRYQSTHLLSSAGVWPKYLAGKWGFTLCTGAVLFKASSEIGKNITKYGSTLYIGMDEVLAHYACTLENSNLHFQFH